MSETTKTSKATTTKKRTQTSEIILGASAKALSAGISKLAEATEALQAMANTAEELETKIAANEERIQELDTEYKEKKRQNQVTLELETKADAAAFVKAHVAESEQTLVNRAEYDQLKKETAELKASFDAELSKRVAIATSGLNKEQANALNLRDSEFRAKEAENAATIKSQMTTIAALTADVAAWKKAADDQREASIKMAQASAIGAVNVTSAK